ncbi:MAG: ABC transporter substrate-binding protein [Dehalococcoidia bacterium]|jgi:branched-chain amino acid transport system substrate-binding protein|nr:ABC transporter substrate-binding protein [Dehalococcoidia bacterium]
MEGFRRRGLALALCGVLVTLGAAAGCASGGNTDTYKIGFIASQTGPYTALGLPAIDGARLVVDQINEAGGVNGKMLELVLYDDKGTSTDTALAAQKLIEVDQVPTLACITATGLSHSMVPILNENETPGLIMSGTGLIDADLGAWAFKPTSSEKDYIPLPLGYLKDDVGVSTCAGMIENSGYGEGGEHYLDLVAPEMGIEVVEMQHFDPAATDMTPQLANIKASGAEAIFIWGSGPAGALAVKQAREMGIMLPIITTPAQASSSYMQSFKQFYEMEPSLVSIDSKLTMWRQLPDSDPDKMLCKEFDEAFLARYNRHPAMWEAIGAQFIMFIADGLDRADPDLGDVVKARSQIRDAYEQTKDLSLFMGTHTMSPDDHYGRIVHKEVLVTYRDGEKVLVKTMTD